MSYTPTYTSLLQEVQDQLTEDDSTFVSHIPDFINRSELQIVRDLDLEIFEGDVTGNLTASQRNQTKAAGLIVTKSLSIVVGGAYVPLQPRAKSFCDMYAPTAATEGQPKYYCEREDDWYVVPTPDAAYAFTARGRKRPTPLSSGNETNWISENAGDLLWCLTMVHANGYLLDTDMAAGWLGLYDSLRPNARRELEAISSNDYGRVRSTARPRLEA